MISLEKIKYHIGDIIFDTINKTNKQQLEKWLKDVTQEIELRKQKQRNGEYRYEIEDPFFKLKLEKQFIEYRLGKK